MVLQNIHRLVVSAMQQGSLYFYMYVFICFFVLCGYNHVSAHMTGHVFTLQCSEILHSLRLLTIYHQVTSRIIWKLWFGAKLNSTLVNGLCLYPFRVPEDRRFMW